MTDIIEDMARAIWDVRVAASRTGDPGRTDLPYPEWCALAAQAALDYLKKSQPASQPKPLDLNVWRPILDVLRGDAP